MNFVKSKIAYLFALAFINLTSFAFEADLSTVKVVSGLCDGDSSVYRGSGMLFKSNENLYVLTSEHVVLHAQSNDENHVCSKAWSPKLGELNTSLIRADWGIGLALMKVEGVYHLDVPTLDFLLSQTKTQNAATAVTYGFPYSSKDLFMGSEGIILNAESDRDYIPLSTKSVEIVNSHGEFGMSGGPVFSTDQAQFIGILSHQYIRYMPGEASSVATYSSQKFDATVAFADHVFAISAESVKEFLVSVFELTGSIPSFVRDTSMQLSQSRDTVFSSGLSFAITSSEEVDGLIGGASGGGIGGASGGGIGGSENNSSNKSPKNLVEISLETSKHLAQWSFEEKNSWIKSVRDTLLRNYRVQIPFFLKKSDGIIPTKVNFSSLAQFFVLLKRADLTPVTVALPTEQIRKQKEPEIINSIKKSAQDLKELLEFFKNEVSANQMATKQYLANLETVSDLLVLGDFVSVDPTWIKTMSKNKPCLKDIINLNFDKGVALIEKINKIESDFGKILVQEKNL